MRNNIAGNIREFVHTKNPKWLFFAIVKLFTQGRVPELMYGIICSVLYKPSALVKPEEICMQNLLDNSRSLLCEGYYGEGDSFLWNQMVVSRDDLIDHFKGRYAVDKMPDDFAGARSESVVITNEAMVIGEYDYTEDCKRICYVNHENCYVIDYYKSHPKVRHIHAIYRNPDSSDVFVTTGDTAKYLDLWELGCNGITFKERILDKYAGYTAIAKIGSDYYMGSDFSYRPNYIERLSDRKKYFFPKQAYKMYVLAFQVHKDRYLVSINYAGGISQQRSLSIFDTQRESFVYCEDVGQIRWALTRHNETVSPMPPKIIV